MDPQFPDARPCEQMSPLISEWVDGRLETAERFELERHLAQCSCCRALSADLRDLRQVAGNLPGRMPRPEVWSRIAGRLQAEPPRRARRFWSGPAIGLALAALLVLAVVASLPVWRGTVTGGTNRPPAADSVAETARARPADGAVHAPAQDLVKDVDEHLRIADSHYEQAIAGLELVVKSEQAALDPAIAGTLQKNLGIIDQAIRESREALKTQPGSQLAQTSLFEALRQKVALLEDTIALINVMRKGDQAGAARIIGGLRKS